MNKQEAVGFIENRNWVGSATSLDRMKELMAKLGDPQKKLRFIHVAGTNGKGSCCATLMAILKAAGYKTGLFTSPHLIEYNERFVIDGKDISDEDFCLACDKVKEASGSLTFVPKVFEVLTAIAFVYFKQKKCDIVVLEVGMGGRLDATNVIDRSDLSIIMNIGLEHTEILGDTLTKIAYEKAGIIKQDGEVIAYDNVPEVLDVFRKVAKERNANLKIADFSKIKIVSEGAGTHFGFAVMRNPEIFTLR